MKTIEKKSLMLAMLVGVASVAVAQDIYDDIYYNPKTDNKVKQVEKKVTQSSAAPAQYPAADTYNYDSGSTMDIDAYNRRGVFAVDTVSTAAGSEDETSDFACTRKIERFYNPDVIVENNDPNLAKVYYAEPQPSVNIIINSPGYWGWGNPYYSYWGWNYPYYSTYWGWNSPFYYASWYGPSWSWTWGWGPGWGGWGPGYGWRPGWGAWGPGWGGYAWGWSRPNNPRHPSAWQANHPGYGRPGGGNNTIGQRPGVNSQRPGGNNIGGGSRPGNERPGVRPDGINNTVRPGAGTGQRPAASAAPGANQNNGLHYQPSVNARPGQLSGGFHTVPATTIQQGKVKYTDRNNLNNREIRTNVNRNTNNGGQRPATVTQPTTQRRPSTSTQYNTNQSTQQRPSYQQNQQNSRSNYSTPSYGGGSRGSMGGGRSAGGSRGGGGRH